MSDPVGSRLEFDLEIKSENVLHIEKIRISFSCLCYSLLSLYFLLFIRDIFHSLHSADGLHPERLIYTVEQLRV